MLLRPPLGATPPPPAPAFAPALAPGTVSRAPLPLRRAGAAGHLAAGTDAPWAGDADLGGVLTGLTSAQVSCQGSCSTHQQHIGFVTVALDVFAAYPCAQVPKPRCAGGSCTPSWYACNSGGPHAPFLWKETGTLRHTCMLLSTGQEVASSTHTQTRPLCSLPAAAVNAWCLWPTLHASTTLLRIHGHGGQWQVAPQLPGTHLCLQLHPWQPSGDLGH